MYLKLVLLNERDYEPQLYKFKNIGFIGYVLELFKNKFTNYKFRSTTVCKPKYDIKYIFLRSGLNTSNNNILKYKDMLIKKEVIFTKNIANEMYFTKILIKI